jgi:hypothetical protein
MATIYLLPIRRNRGEPVPKDLALPVSIRLEAETLRLEGLKHLPRPPEAAAEAALRHAQKLALLSAWTWKPCFASLCSLLLPHTLDHTAVYCCKCT